MIVKKEIEVAKEFGDIMELVKELVSALKNKTGYESVLAKLIPAIDGIGDVDDEVKANMQAFINTGVLAVSDIIAILSAKKAE